MKTLSLHLLSEIVINKRKSLHITQTELAKQTGINRSLISKLEDEKFTPSVDQLLALSEVLGFDISEVCRKDNNPDIKPLKSYKITVAGTGYVGLSLAVLLAQHNTVTAIDIIPEKVEKLNKYISPIQDEYIEKYLDEAKNGKREYICVSILYWCFCFWLTSLYNRLQFHPPH